MKLPISYGRQYISDGDIQAVVETQYLEKQVIIILKIKRVLKKEKRISSLPL
jgi:hypothetical protein